MSCVEESHSRQMGARAKRSSEAKRPAVTPLLSLGNVKVKGMDSGTELPGSESRLRHLLFVLARY